jgi:mRNA-degrading endonuclease RelE of RelBE toxin-antitoxin system
MNFELRTARRATDYLDRLDRRSRSRILGRLDQIVADPYGPHTKALTNDSGTRAARVGGWRILFTIGAEARTVTVTDIRHEATCTDICNAPCEQGHRNQKLDDQSGSRAAASDNTAAHSGHHGTACCGNPML